MNSGEVIKNGRAESKGGRKPDLYQLPNEAFYIQNVDINKYNVRTFIYDCSDETLTEAETIRLTLNNEKETFEKICEFLIKHQNKSGLANEKIIAVAIAKYFLGRVN